MRMRNMQCVLRTLQLPGVQPQGWSNTINCVVLLSPGSRLSYLISPHLNPSAGFSLAVTIPDLADKSSYISLHTAKQLPPHRSVGTSNGPNRLRKSPETKPLRRVSLLVGAIAPRHAGDLPSRDAARHWSQTVHILIYHKRELAHRSKPSSWSHWHYLHETHPMSCPW
jgi:hypothetical protein